MPLHSIAADNFFSRPANTLLANWCSKLHWRILFAYSTAANITIDYFFAVLLQVILLMRTVISKYTSWPVNRTESAEYCCENNYRCARWPSRCVRAALHRYDKVPRLTPKFYIKSTKPSRQPYDRMPNCLFVTLNQANCT